VCPRLIGALTRESLENRPHGERQLTVAKVTGASPTQWETWDSISWNQVYHEVRRLQVRIAKAVREERWNKVYTLQHRLTRSYTARLWAVRRVVSNRGRNTSGIDGVIWETDEQKLEAARSIRFRGYRAEPLRRIYIPKSNSDKLRPLGIPTMKDRTMQALYALALDPVAEVVADLNAYGFRRSRSLHDAVAQCFIVLAKKASPKWILEGDIKACFDQIDHDWLLQNIPMEKKVLRGWLKAGYIEDNARYATEAGTPQGGIISPILANMTLDLLETVAKQSVPKGQGHKVNVVKYADDFIITGASRALLEDRVKPAITDFLATRGLSLSQEKTHISHIDEGFDFLGVNIRKYSGKLLITPAPKKVLAFRESLKELIQANISNRLGPFLKLLNSKLRGWAQHYRGVVSKRVFSEIDEYVYQLLRRWMRLRHRNKTNAWCKKRYFHRIGMRWVFGTRYINRKGQTSHLKLFKLSDLPIRRHIKIDQYANPYDPIWDGYYRDRRRRNFLHRKRDREFLATPPLTRMAW
jgi:RNA-directed DNA polymerase